MATNDNALRFRTGNTFRVWLNPEGHFENGSHSFLIISRERSVNLAWQRLKWSRKKIRARKTTFPSWMQFCFLILSFNSVEINLSLSNQNKNIFCHGSIVSILMTKASIRLRNWDSSTFDQPRSAGTRDFILKSHSRLMFGLSCYFPPRFPVLLDRKQLFRLQIFMRNPNLLEYSIRSR